MLLDSYSLNFSSHRLLNLCEALEWHWHIAVAQRTECVPHWIHRLNAMLYMSPLRNTWADKYHIICNFSLGIQCVFVSILKKCITCQEMKMTFTNINILLLKLWKMLRMPLPMHRTISRVTPLSNFCKTIDSVCEVWLVWMKFSNSCRFIWSD